MITSSARLSAELRSRLLGVVASRADLRSAGFSSAMITAQLDAGRWQRAGRAVVLHNGPLTVHQRWSAALINCGPRSVLTSFTALSASGLLGWDRPAVHILVPAGARVTETSGTTVHYTGQWDAQAVHPLYRRHRVPQATARAAASVTSPRVACGLLACVVQQRLCRVGDLGAAVTGSPRLRHRRELSLALSDIGMGAHALSEIDFAQLCRRHHLPEPVRQAVRRDPSGRRRYLDAEWQLSDGRTLVVEVDGSLHTSARHWWDDQLRQNVLTLAGSPVLRYPSVIVRQESDLVAGQLRLMLR